MKSADGALSESDGQQRYAGGGGHLHIKVIACPRFPQEKGELALVTLDILVHFISFHVLRRLPPLRSPTVGHVTQYAHRCCQLTLT